MILSGWPDSIAASLREKAPGDHERAMDAIMANRCVCFGEAAWPEHRGIIRSAMPELVEGHYQHVFRRIIPDMVDGREAARAIGIRSPSMARLIRSGALRPVIARGTARTHGSFARADVDTVAAAVADSVAATSIVEDLGVPLHAVEQWVCTELLDRASHPAIDALFPVLRITGTSRLKLHDRIRSGASRPDGREDAIPPRHAVLRIGGREKPWAAILSAMIEGRIRYPIARPTGRLVERIDVVRSPDLDAVLEETFDRANHSTFRFAELMRRRDALELLNVDPIRWQDIARRLGPSSLGPHKTLVVREMLSPSPDGSSTPGRRSTAGVSSLLVRR